MNIGFVTNIRSPYRKLQFEKFSQIKDFNFKIYYTNKNYLERRWNVSRVENVKEQVLKGIKISTKYGHVNGGLLRIVKDNDIILLGGYEQPTYVLLSILARVYKIPYAIIFDGISKHKVINNNKNIKYYLKSLVINNAGAIFGNGTISRMLFNDIYKYDVSKIYNQYLTIDVKAISNLYNEKEKYRKIMREKYKISLEKKVIIFSGRLVKIKNVNLIIKAIANLEMDNILLLILGDGEEKENLIALAKELKVDFRISGFIEEQIELFKSYFCGDLLILPSMEEAWGLVVNEAMAAGLPVITSDSCGSSLDLIKAGENGLVVKTGSVEELTKAINLIFSKNEYSVMGRKSRELIQEWTFDKSKESFEKMIQYLAAAKSLQ